MLFRVLGVVASSALVIVSARTAASQTAASAFVPGSGTKIDYVSDDFEDANWGYVHKHPKSSREQDEQVRHPTGGSTNGRWHEGPERGQPDQIEVIATPKGGLEGSTRSLLMRTLHSGIPGRNTRDVQQDDLIAAVPGRLRGGVPIAERPSVTVRVYLPPVEQWERRTGPQFGFRTSATTMTRGKSRGLFSSSSSEAETYWPGMWIHFRAAGSRGVKADSAFITVRANRMGHDIPVRDIAVEDFGWWTLGMSYSADGMVHYYASPGVDELTQADYLTSQYPYSYQARQLRTYFFDVCNLNDGRTWSTPFVIDDPALYVVNASRINSIVQQKERQEEQMAERRSRQASGRSSSRAR